MLICTSRCLKNFDTDMPTIATPNTINTFHYMDLEKGKFCRTTAQNLVDAFTHFNQSSQLGHLCVFFHRRLTSRAEGLKTANRLIGGYTNSGAYPFFFIWNSSLFDALQKRMQSDSKDLVFVTAANYAFQTVANKMKNALDKEKSLKSQPRLSTRRSRAAPRTLEQLSLYAKPYDRAWANRAGEQLGCSSSDLNRFAQFLVSTEKTLSR